MFVWTQQLSGQLIVANSACQAQMPMFSTSHVPGNGRAVTYRALRLLHSLKLWVLTKSKHRMHSITLFSIGSLFNQKKCIFYTLQQKCMAKVNVFYKHDQAKLVLLSLTDRHSCSREAASSTGDEETWWGYQRLSMVTMELKTNLQLRRATQVWVCSGRNSGQQTQLSSDFL